MSSVQIVEAKAEDANAIGFIQSQTWLCAYPNPKMGISKEDIEKKLKEFKQKGDARILAEMQKENSKTWVANVGEKIVGFVGVQKLGDEGKILALHVLPENQGQGIGTELLKTAQNWLKDIKKITVEVVNYNESAIAFYEKFGFIKAGEANDDPINLPSGKVISKILMVKNSS
jgi:[ribosomal protein S18]-alanine N-acetyltransferase